MISSLTRFTSNELFSQGNIDHLLKVLSFQHLPCFHCDFIRPECNSHLSYI
jgi:hypothetical protein